MKAYVVRWEVKCHQGNDYLMPWETCGAMAFGGSNDANLVAKHLQKLGIPDGHGFSNACDSVEVTIEDVDHQYVLHRIPKWVTKDRIAI